MTLSQNPRDAGQTVDRQYGCDGEYVYCRTHDRSGGTVTWARATIAPDHEDETLHAYQIPTAGDWQDCDEPQGDE